MALKQWCGKECSECKGCKLDEMIPCSPDCENLTKDGKIKVDACLKSKSACGEVKYVLGQKILVMRRFLQSLARLQIILTQACQMVD